MTQLRHQGQHSKHLTYVTLKEHSCNQDLKQPGQASEARGWEEAQLQVLLSKNILE